MKKDKCWAQCGSEGDHSEWGPHYYPCGTMKCSSIRGEACYEREIARKDALLEKMGGLLQEVLKFNQYWFEEYPGNHLTQPTTHSLEHLTIKIKALLTDLEAPTDD